VLSGVRDRDVAIGNLQRQKRRKAMVPQCLPEPPQPPAIAVSQCQQHQSEPEGFDSSVVDYNEASIAGEIEPVKPKKPVPYVRVYESYEQIEREWRLQ
jgi:putative transposase